MQRPVCFPFFPFGILSWEPVFYGCHRAQKQQEYTHTGSRQCFCHSSLECAEPLLCKWANMGPCKPLCVHCKDLSYHLRGCRKKTSLSQSQTHADKHLGFLQCRTSMWCSRCILYTWRSPFNHWDSLHFYLNLFYKEQIQFGSFFPAQGRKTESLLVPEGTIKYSCLFNCSS